MPVSESQKRAKKRYDRQTREYVFRLRKAKDADVIAALDSCENKTELLRALVRQHVTDGN